MQQFKELNGYPTSMSATTALSRLTEGIGFRYYWGTEGLTDADVSYSPGNEGRTVYETTDHIYYMAIFVANTLEGKPTSFPESASGLEYAALRNATLEKLSQIRALLDANKDQDLGENKVTGTVAGNPFDAPIWHLINGPVLDLGHHIGQLIMLRRLSGNPIDPNVQPFMGKNMAA